MRKLTQTILELTAILALLFTLAFFTTKAHGQGFP